MCMDYLKRMEERWVTAGRFWDLLAGLSTAHRPLGKRRRDDADDANSADSSVYSGGGDRSKAPLRNFMDLLLPTEELVNSGTPSTAATNSTPDFQEWMYSVTGTSIFGDPAAPPANEGMGTTQTDFAHPEAWLKTFSTNRLAEMVGHPQDSTNGPMMDEALGMWASALPGIFDDWPMGMPPTMPDFQADPLPPLFPYTEEPMGNSERPSWF